MTGTTLDELRMIVAIEEHGSLTGAAEALGITQQAVSQRMRALERRWGLALFARSARGTRLTDQGTLVAEWAATLVGQADAFDSAVASLRSDRAAHVRVGASLTIAEHLVPGWLVTYAADPSAAHVELTAVNSVTVASRVRSGKDDLGFVESPDLPEGLASYVFMKDEVVLVVAPDHPWAKRTEVSPAEVARTPLVSREEGSGTRLAMERALEIVVGAGSVVAPAAELSTTAAVRATIVAGGGVGALSARAVRDDLDAGRLRRVHIDGPAALRPFAAVWNPQRRLAPGAARILEIASATA